MSHHEEHHLARPPKSWGYRIAVAGFFAIIAYFLWTEHRAHIASLMPFLPYLLLLACPLMHIFMHRGHSGPHGHHPDHRDGEPKTGRE